MSGEDHRPKTKADFEELGRWIDWDKLLEAVKVHKGKYLAAQGEKTREGRGASPFDLIGSLQFSHIYHLLAP